VRRLACLALALALLAPATARADGDPASDVLLQDDVFFPYAPKTAPRLSGTLKSVLRRTRRAGYPMKVALIESANDLGAAADLFGQPQEYANVLSNELRTIRHGHAAQSLHVLVVMPAGFSGTNLGDRVDEALAPIRIDAAAQSDGLARAAIEAVARIASANGHPMAIPAVAKLPLAPRHESTKRSGTSALPFLLPVAAIAVGLVVAGWLSRRRGRDPA
jgi:GNAT superfamily N-acetyltransferase